MAFEKFKQNIIAYMKKAGVSGSVEFNHDTDKGLYSAWIPGEEILITCRESGLGMSARFHNHVYPIKA